MNDKKATVIGDVSMEMRMDPTLPECFQAKAQQIGAFTMDAVSFMARAHQTHNELGTAVDMYISSLVSMFHALPVEKEYLDQIKALILKRWDQQATIMEQGIDSLPMAYDRKH